MMILSYGLINMNKFIKKAFTLVELLVVIAILATLATVGVVSYSNYTKKAHDVKNKSIITQANTLLATNEVIEGKFNYSKDAYAFLESYNITKSDLASNDASIVNYFNNKTNRIESINLNEEDPNIDPSSKTYLQSFNTVKTNTGYTGFKTYTDSTTFTYKYMDSNNVVYTGDTIIEDNTLYYYLHVPFNYKPYKEYPILTFIHGTNDSLYVQSDESRTGCEVLPLSDFTSSSSYALKMLGGVARSGAGHQGSIRSNKLSDGTLNAMGPGAGDDNFVNTLINEIKQDESLDCFILLVNLNDEIWWENRAQYTINVEGTDKTVQALDIRNSYKVGYGSKVDTKSYSGTYLASELGPNVWFQLLTKLSDQLAYDYSIDLDRQYIMGFSLGGLATFDLISHYPNRYAAAVAICAAGADPSSANIVNIDTTKVLCMHGASDGWVSSVMGQQFISELNNQYAGHGQFISVSGYGHSCAFLSNPTYQYGYNYVKNFVFGSSR